MVRALELAARGVGRVSPNPPVGAVAVRDGEIIAEGYHQQFGGPHAERALIQSVPTGSLAGSDLFVTLEPCAHHGKTPPCTEAILETGFRSVSYATEDPNPETRGLGVARLEAAGIVVERGLLDAESRALLAGYLKHTVCGLPLVTAKWAMTVDGRIASVTGDSRWISCPESLARTRAERTHYDGILVGRGTVAIDDPLLTDRSSSDANPTRIVLDSELQLSLESQLVATATEVPVIAFADKSRPGVSDRAARLQQHGVTVEWCDGDATGLSVPCVVERLGSLSMTTVLVEGGADVHGSFISRGCVDRVQVVIGGKIVGGRDAPGPVGGDGYPSMAEAISLSALRTTRVGNDVWIEGAITEAGLGNY